MIYDWLPAQSRCCDLVKTTNLNSAITVFIYTCTLWPTSKTVDPSCNFTFLTLIFLVRTAVYGCNRGLQHRLTLRLTSSLYGWYLAGSSVVYNSQSTPCPHAATRCGELLPSPSGARGCGLQSLCITETVFDAKDTAINREVVSCGLQLVKNTIHFSYFFKYVEIS